MSEENDMPEIKHNSNGDWILDCPKDNDIYLPDDLLVNFHKVENYQEDLASETLYGGLKEDLLSQISKGGFSDDLGAKVMNAMTLNGLANSIKAEDGAKLILFSDDDNRDTLSLDALLQIANTRIEMIPLEIDAQGIVDASSEGARFQMMHVDGDILDNACPSSVPDMVVATKGDDTPDLP